MSRLFALISSDLAESNDFSWLDADASHLCVFRRRRSPVRHRAVCSPQRDPLEGVVDAELAKAGARTPRDGRLESVRMTPVIRAFVTWNCGVGPISSGRPSEGCSHVRRLPPPRPLSWVRVGGGMRGCRGKWKREELRVASPRKARWTTFEERFRRGWSWVGRHGCRVVQKREARGDAAGAERGSRSFPCTGKRERRIYLLQREINDVRDKEREKERK